MSFLNGVVFFTYKHAKGQRMLRRAMKSALVEQGPRTPPTLKYTSLPVADLTLRLRCCVAFTAALSSAIFAVSGGRS